MDMSQYQSLFLNEAREHLNRISSLTVTLESAPDDRPTIDALFRSAHSIKGMAASMGFTAIADLAHRLEDLLDRVRKGLVPDRGVIDLLLAGESALATMLSDIAGGGPGSIDTSELTARLSSYEPGSVPAAATEAQPTVTADETATPPETPGRDETIPQVVKVKTALLDQFVTTTGELITVRNRLETLAASASNQEMRTALQLLGKHLRELHDQVMAVRLLPLAIITENFPRLVRDLARKSGKEATFSLKGAEVELDRSIIELLGDPLTHLLRNSVDHGIETPEERVAAGKQARGKISISVTRLRDQVEIRIEDDGRGMDPAAICQAAQAKGFITAEQAAVLNDDDKLLLVCHPGFSTARELSDISGRGVGMDLVKNAIQGLGGILSISSTIGQGSCFLLRLPLTIAIINVLLVEAAGYTMAIPLTMVNRTVEISSDEIATIDGSDVFFLNGESVPLLPLGRLLHQPPTAGEPPAIVPLLLTEFKDRLIALQVDRLLGTREVFVRPLGRPLATLPGLIGTAILGNGEVVFVIDITGKLQ